MSIDNTIFISELFSSIQGESSLSGFPTTFIRLAGCNLRCAWCDSKFSYKNGTAYEVGDLVRYAQNEGFHYVCITGGEPLVQPAVYALMNSLLDSRLTVSIETNGSMSIEKIPEKVRIILDVKCPGSRQDSANWYKNLEIVSKKDEVKFVVTNREDFDFAHEIIAQYDLIDKTNVLLSPVWGACDPKQLVQWMLEKKSLARLNMQLHKCIWGNDIKGV